jgi:AraC-like DNA-binding protein
MQLSNSDIIAIQSVKCIIECRVHQRIAIKELCELSGLGESKLTKAFKFCYQTSIFQYQLFISMEYAKALIEDGMQVKAVAILLGYRKMGHFTRAFSKVFDRPPSGFKLKKEQYVLYPVSGF